MSEYFRKPIVKTLMLKGQEGQSIKGIEKTSTDGFVDTYTITLTDGTTSTFTVTNGREISDISKTGTSGLVDTYTITFNDGATSTFTVTNGKEISGISKTGTSGLVDTYTITFNDGTTSTFTVTNGAKGDKGDTGPRGPRGPKGEDNKPAVDALEKRLDNLILASGTESSAEVIDARTGYDRTAYPTLGTAIRTQVSELKEDLSQLDEHLNVCRNIANPNDIVQKSVYFNSKNYSSNDTWSTTVVKVLPNTVYTIWNCETYYCWYSNENGDNLGAIGVKEGIITTPDNCTELHLSHDKLTTNFYVVNGNVINDIAYKTDIDYLFVVDSKVKKLENDTKPLTEKIYMQYVDKTKSSENEYWTYGNKNSANGYLAYEPIVLTPGTYTLFNASGEFTFWNDGTWNNLKLITGIALNNEKTVIELTKNTTFYITRDPIIYDTMIVNGDIESLPYTEYGKFTSFASKEEVNKAIEQRLSKVFYVGSNEQFTKIKDAVEEAIKYKNSTVYIQSGTYDLIQEFGAEYLESTTTETGIKLTNGISLIFSQQAKVVCNYNGSNPQILTEFSAFNTLTQWSASGMKRADCTIDGLNIECSNIRYCIHDEHSGSDVPYTNHYINCYMKLDNTLNREWTSLQCIGGGLGLCGLINVENSIFNSVNNTEEVKPAVSWHNSSFGDGKGLSKVIIKDCVFIGNKNTVECGCYGASTEKTPFIVTNCKLKAQPYKWNSGQNDNMELIAYNNTIDE